MAQTDQVTKGADTTVLPMAGWGWSWGSCTPIMGPQALSVAEMFHQEILFLSCFHSLRLRAKRRAQSPQGLSSCFT